MNLHKYRCYDERNDELVYSQEDDCFYINTKGILFMYAIPKSESGVETLYYKSYDVESFTGRVDANGVDVYLGDIINQGGMYAPVVWNKDWSCFELDFSIHSVEEDELPNLDFSDFCNRAVVVGNVHQDIGLLW